MAALNASILDSVSLRDSQTRPLQRAVHDVITALLLRAMLTTFAALFWGKKVIFITFER